MKNGFSIRSQQTPWLNGMAETFHYMHRPIHSRSCPFGWSLTWNDKVFLPNGNPVGFIIYATVHYTKLKGEFGYPDLPTKWQVLSLGRLWINPEFQSGGKYYTADILPGFSDRKGNFRSTLATWFIQESIDQLQKRWIEVHPPRFPDEPYHIVKIISYCDTRFFKGATYRAAGFREHGQTISQRRHKNTRGSGMDGAKLIRFIKDLQEPTWKYEPEKKLQMELL